MACISDFSSNNHVIFLVGNYFFFQWKENQFVLFSCRTYNCVDNSYWAA